MEKSIYNRIISIFSSIATIVLMTLIIIFQSLKHNSIVFLILLFVTIFIYFILKSIYTGKDNNEALRRLSESFKDLSLVLVSIFILLMLNNLFKWILFSFVIVLGILLIIINSINKQIEIKYVFETLILLMVNVITINIVGNNYLYYLMLGSNVSFIISDIVGTITKNKILNSFDIISLILLGLFFIFI